MKRLIALIVGLVFVASACGDNPHHLTAGNVINRNHYLAHNETYYIPITTTICSGGQYISCSTLIIGMLPVEYYYPEAWALTIENCGPDNNGGRDKKGRCYKGVLWVPQDVYDANQYGVYWKVPLTEKNKPIYAQGYTNQPRTKTRSGNEDQSHSAN